MRFTDALYYLTLISTVSAALLFHCAAFEPLSKGGSARELGLSIASRHVAKKTTVLMYPHEAVAYSNIPPILDGYGSSKTRGGFKVCSYQDTQTFSTDCYGERTGKFIYEVTEERFASQVISVPMTKKVWSQEVGERGGIYCLAVYQDSDELEGVEFIEKHTFGEMSLYDHQQFLSAIFVTILYISTAIGVKFVFVDTKKPFHTNLSLFAGPQSLKLTLSHPSMAIITFACLLKALSVCHFMTDFLPVEYWWVKLDLTSAYHCYLSFTVYKVSGAGFKSKSSSVFKKALFKGYISIAAVLVFEDQLTYALDFPPKLFHVFELLFHTITGYIVIVAFFHSREFSKLIINPTITRHYNKSRACMVSIPILFWLISKVSVALFLLQSGLPAFTKHGARDITLSLAPAWLRVCAHAPDASLLFCVWAIICIWRTDIVMIDELYRGSVKVDSGDQ